MALLSRDQILDAKDLKTKDVSVPEWGGDIRIRMLTGKERDDFEASLVEMKRDGSAKRNIENVRARLATLCIINEAGELMFNRADIRMLGNKSSAALGRVFDAINELNAFSDEDIEDLAEGFGETPIESSTSD
ncbi:hypothetical protein ACGFZA_16025 [Streptomyces sp. NPDC048211]|uniref:hypothetical protein n=1 Tax=Streptomyces sp. NPDC048211 TaxID=3365516 RepID=UPI0037231C7C